ncbi:MAG: GNAT family N-acetyltransferase [Lysobacterales bacterium]|jgi:ElaA protein
MKRSQHALDWRWQRLSGMTPELLYGMLAMREAIFVVEQGCVYQELDGRDLLAQHLVGLAGSEPVACLRLLPPGSDSEAVRIGRVAVAAAYRKQGFARQMMRMAIARARQQYPAAAIALSAQSYLRKFYESLGFSVCGDEYLEDGIAHLPMRM